MAVAEPGRKSDLGVRTLSAIVMLAVAGTALWLGGWWWNVLAVAIGLGVLWEWWNLACGITPRLEFRALWLLGGLAYIGQAVMALIALRHSSLMSAMTVILLVIAVDVGAYFAGRTIGGPKIAPKISPSKTWAGLGGAVVAAYLVYLGIEISVTATIFSAQGQGGGEGARQALSANWAWMLPAAAIVAVVAQAGDFFESWMKRKAGVKDSGNLIPGHGGLFDRTDGLIAVLCLVAIVYRAV